jgi:zinc D-Ala-D-Ala dipeptidase
MLRGLSALLVCALLACAGWPTRVGSGAPPATAEAPLPALGPSLAPVLDPGPPPVAAVDLSGLATPPTGFVDLRRRLPEARFAVGYATSANFTGAVLPGYGAPGAWLRTTAADALALAQADLREKGLNLVVYDAYRPLRATRGMVAWAERTDQVFLLDQHYVSRYSGHNRGNTIDLSVEVLATGHELDMGTPWDTLNESSHTRNATGKALENRLLLKAILERRGFRNYWKEWWHYTFVEEGEPELPHRDVPYGCAELPEGRWVAPAGWNRPGAVVEPPPSGPCR